MEVSFSWSRVNCNLRDLWSIGLNVCVGERRMSVFLQLQHCLLWLVVKVFSK